MWCAEKCLWSQWAEKSERCRRSFSIRLNLTNLCKWGEASSLWLSPCLVADTNCVVQPHDGEQDSIRSLRWKNESDGEGQNHLMMSDLCTEPFLLLPSLDAWAIGGGGLSQTREKLTTRVGEWSCSFRCCYTNILKKSIFDVTQASGGRFGSPLWQAVNDIFTSETMNWLMRCKAHLVLNHHKHFLKSNIFFLEWYLTQVEH